MQLNNAQRWVGTDVEIIKLFDGIYRISPSLEPFHLQEIHEKYSPDNNYYEKIRLINQQISEFFYKKKFENAHPSGWGPSSSEGDNTGSAKYHIDGIFDGIFDISAGKCDYMLLCALSNNLTNGTYLKTTTDNGEVIRILTKPWTPYLIRGDILHRGRPIKFDVRACIRWYFNSMGKLP